MKKLSAIVLTMLVVGSYAFAGQGDKQKQSTTQTNASADAKSHANAQAEPGSVTLDSGSQINAELSSTLDLKKSKPGDPFKMRTMRPVKRDGKDIISRGSTITGHVQQVTRASGAMQATLVFDQLQDQKSHLVSPLSAVITAVAKADSTASAMAGDDSMPPPMSGGGNRSTRSQSSSSQSGGLLGGVTQTAAGAAGQVGSTVNSTTSSTVRSTTGVTVAATGLTRGAIQIVSDTTAAATSGSTLATSDRSPKIESGTQFVLQTTSALTLTRNANPQ